MVTDTLRETIKKSDLSLYELARRTGLERASLSRFVRRERHLRSDAIDKIAAFFDLALTPVARRRRA